MSKKDFKISNKDGRIVAVEECQLSYDRVWWSISMLMQNKQSINQQTI